MITYINCRTQYGVETYDEVDSKDYPTNRARKAAVRELVRSYHVAGENVYTSTRCTKEWRDR